MTCRLRFLPTLAALAFLTVTAARGQDKAVAPRVPPTFPGVSSVLWVAAHPSTEWAVYLGPPELLLAANDVATCP
jgi:hypothetical protein